jgi:hypothetical protein
MTQGGPFQNILMSKMRKYKLGKKPQCIEEESLEKIR